MSALAGARTAGSICAANQECENNVCVAGGGGGGGALTGECASNDNACLQQCAGSECSAEYGACTADTPVEEVKGQCGGDGAECTSDDGCPATPGACELAEGVSPTDMPNDATPASCGTDEECGDDYVCAGAEAGGSCEGYVARGGSCANLQTCLGGCQDQTC